MEVIVNKKPMSIPENIKITELLSLMGLNSWVSVIVNGVMILQGNYECTCIKDNDNIVIFRPLAGG